MLVCKWTCWIYLSRPDVQLVRCLYDSQTHSVRGRNYKNWSVLWETVDLFYITIVFSDSSSFTLSPKPITVMFGECKSSHLTANIVYIVIISNWLAPTVFWYRIWFSDVCMCVFVRAPACNSHAFYLWGRLHSSTCVTAQHLNDFRL